MVHVLIGRRIPERPKYRIHPGLIACSLAFEPLEHILIEPQRYQCLGRHWLQAPSNNASNNLLDIGFRMLFGLDGVDAHAEDSWVGRRVAFGDAVVRLRGLVGRCAVTTHDPDTGLPDLDTLRILTGYRSDVESDEPLPIGVWGGVEQPGRVRVGDPVEPL